MEERERFMEALRRAQQRTRNVVRRWDNGTVSNEEMERAWDDLSRAYLDASEYGPERYRRLYARLAQRYAAAAQQHVT